MDGLRRELKFWKKVEFKQERQKLETCKRKQKGPKKGIRKTENRLSRQWRKESCRKSASWDAGVQGHDGERFYWKKERIPSWVSQEETGTELRFRHYSLLTQTVLEKVLFDFVLGGNRANVKSEEIKGVSLVEEHCWCDLVDGNPQFRRRKEKQRLAEESVEFWQEQGTKRTMIARQREAHADLVMWPKKKET